MEPSRPFCAETSAETGEPLAATASRVDHWILVEYRGQWSRDVLGGSGLSDQVKRHVREQLDALPNSRLLFIRKPERRRVPGLSVYTARSLEQDVRLSRLEVESYVDLLALDLTAEPGEAVTHPFFVVCTHGKRDRCCARHGRPLYDELRVEVDEHWVWQSTHVGGDRFAGNLVCLPEGLYYGRVGRLDAAGILDDYVARKVTLDRYRGRSCYSFPVQAAERLVRVDGGRTGFDDLSLLAVERTADRSWRVRFLAGRDEHEVEVAERAGEPFYLTCSSATPQRPRHFEAIGHRVRPAR